MLAPLVADGATEPGDVGPAAVFMASGDADWLNGRVIGAGDHRIVLFEGPVIEYEALVIDGWDREVVFAEMEQAVHSAVERTSPVQRARGSQVTAATNATGEGFAALSSLTELIEGVGRRGEARRLGGGHADRFHRRGDARTSW